jgi:hypothetical protein
MKRNREIKVGTYIKSITRSLMIVTGSLHGITRPPKIDILEETKRSNLLSRSYNLHI